MLHNTIDEKYPDARRRGRADDHDADAEELAAHAYCCGVLHAAAAPGWANLTAETLTRQVKGLLGSAQKARSNFGPHHQKGARKKRRIREIDLAQPLPRRYLSTVAPGCD